MFVNEFSARFVDPSTKPSPQHLLSNVIMPAVYRVLWSVCYYTWRVITYTCLLSSMIYRVHTLKLGPGQCFIFIDNKPIHPNMSQVKNACNTSSEAISQMFLPKIMQHYKKLGRHIICDS